MIPVVWLSYSEETPAGVTGTRHARSPVLA